MKEKRILLLAIGPLDWDNVPEHLWYRGPTAASSKEFRD